MMYKKCSTKTIATSANTQAYTDICYFIKLMNEKIDINTGPELRKETQAHPQPLSSECVGIEHIKFLTLI